MSGNSNDMPHSSTSVPVALTIAGSDCSGGAGVQADLKTFLQHGVHGLSAVTSIVAETPLEVRRIEDVDITTLQAQVNVLLETYPVAAIKTGMLPTRASVIAVVELLADSNAMLVVDPVMVASSGASLLGESAAEVMMHRLLPMATLVTPNLPEAEVMLGRKIEGLEAMAEAAQEVSNKFHCACLLKGGHLNGESTIHDVLWHEGKAQEFIHPQQEGSFHGTGCTLSAAITARLAQGDDLATACETAISYLQQLITQAKQWPSPQGEIVALGW